MASNSDLMLKPQILQARIFRPFWSSKQDPLRVELPLGRAAYQDFCGWFAGHHPPGSMALEASGGQALLRALKVLSKCGSPSEPGRWVPVHFKEPNPLVVNHIGYQGLQKPWLSGVRFFVSWNSTGGSSEELKEPSAWLRVAAKTKVGALARAIAAERQRMRRSGLLGLEASCSPRHATVISEALAWAQELAFRSEDTRNHISCTVQIVEQQKGLKHEPDEEAPKGKERTPRLIRVKVWPADILELSPGQGFKHHHFMEGITPSSHCSQRRHEAEGDCLALHHVPETGLSRVGSA